MQTFILILCFALMRWPGTACMYLTLCISNEVRRIAATMHNQYAGSLPPQALGECSKGVAITRQTQAADNGQTSPSALTAKRSKAVVIIPVR